MSIDHVLLVAGGKVDSGAKVARCMEKSEIVSVVEHLPEPQECWVALAYTDDFTDHDMGTVIKYVLTHAKSHGFTGKIDFEDIIIVVDALRMMVENAIGKTINGRERYSRQTILDVLDIDRSQFVPSRFWGRMESMVDKITHALDCGALDAVDDFLRRRVQRGEAA
ncbi:MAG: hypothetical protein EP334_10160 [Gammaproteobacteria bacterium]|nr:MAG: hypothetical protein EP334_10160 [Gammaproteobacteria bacterium]